MDRTRLIAVGACAIDTILTVPYYPSEDSKLRATSLTKRRGGNCPNTIEVLRQLANLDCEGHNSANGLPNPTKAIRASSITEMFLIATLPAQISTQVEFITSSFEDPTSTDPLDAPHYESMSSERAASAKVNLSHCLFREDFAEPMSSYIISSQASSSRTIVNHSPLPEMKRDEFVDVTRDLREPFSTKDIEQIWFHFEGRNVPTILECMRYLRKLDAFEKREGQTAHVQLKVSVELEKPGRSGLQELAYEADVIFYSRSWAEAEGYGSADICLTEQTKLLRANNTGQKADVGERLLICTWGVEGACAVALPESSSSAGILPNTLGTEVAIVHSSAYVCPGRPIMDTTGAGDTFIAGALFGLICRGRGSQTDFGTWSLKQTLDFANGLAGRKILQDGFQGLGQSSKGLIGSLDLTVSQQDGKAGRFKAYG